MKYDLGDTFSLGEEKYMVAETSTYMDMNYLLLSKLDNNEEPTNEMFVYKVEGIKLIKVTDKSILDIMIPVFTNKIQRNVNVINNENKYNIN